MSMSLLIKALKNFYWLHIKIQIIFLLICYFFNFFKLKNKIERFYFVNKILYAF